MGLAFYTADALPQKYRGGAFVGEHGSWDRQQLNGYKVVFVPFSGGHPNGKAEDVVTGFLNASNQARGRPVGVADKTGALLIADDVGTQSGEFRLQDCSGRRPSGVGGGPLIAYLGSSGDLVVDNHDYRWITLRIFDLAKRYMCVMNRSCFVDCASDFRLGAEFF